MRGFCHKHQMEINDSLGCRSCVYEAEEEKRLRTREPAKQNEFDSRRLQPALDHLDDMLRKLLNPYDGRYDEVKRALEHLRAIREAVSMSATGLPLPSCGACSRSAPCVYRDFVHCVEWGSTRDAYDWCPSFEPEQKEPTDPSPPAGLPCPHMSPVVGVDCLGKIYCNRYLHRADTDWCCDGFEPGTKEMV
jgi:hypothetical protein